MRTFCYAIFLAHCALSLTFGAEPTEIRKWASTSGSTVDGRVLAVVNSVARLERADGPEVNVPLSAFVEADRALLIEHFGVKADESGGLEVAGEPKGSDSVAATGMPHELGVVHGPIDAGDGATYFLYLPKSLKQDRKAPFLLYTNSGRGNANGLKTFIEGAEVCGWVLAMSVESSNAAGFVTNLKVSKATVAHVIETLPVDPTRVYFTGNSGGGATAMMNAAEIECAGAMPNIGYIPSGHDPNSKGHYFVLGGGKDYNRYLSAYIGKRFKKNAVHRMHPGGHGGGPQSLFVDGIFWLNMRYLLDQRGDHDEEAADFEAALITWMNENKEKDPQRVYSTARLLKDDYSIGGTNKELVEQIIAELGKKQNNVKYHEGLLAIDELSEKKMAEFGEGGGSKFRHTDKSVIRAAEKLLEEYGSVPFIGDTLKAIIEPTVGS